MPDLLPALPPAADLLPALLDLSVSGVVYYRPVRDAAGAVADLAFAYLNPAAQQLLRLPARPATTFLQQFPGSVAAGIWDFHRAALAADGPRELRQPYQADGYDAYYVVAARPVADGLLVSFTHDADQLRAAIGQALHDSHAREQAARAEAERQREELQQVFEQAPVALAVLRGPAHVLEVVNPTMAEMLGRPAADLLRRPYADALPELVAQGYAELLDQVWRTGQPVVQQEVPARLARHQPGEVGYFTFVFQPVFAGGQVRDITCVAVDVTGQVLARRASEATAQRLHLLTNALPVLIAYLDLEERYRFVNEAYGPWFGRDPQQVLGLSVRELVGEAAYAGIQPYLARARAGEQLTFELRMPYRPDHVRYIRTTYVPDVQDGELRGFYSLITDVTEPALARQQVEQANRALEARVAEHTAETQAARAAAERGQDQLRALFEQAPVAIALFQGEEVLVASANERMAALWGRTPAQVVGRTLLAGVPELAGQGFDTMIREVLTTGVPYVGTEAPAQLLQDGALVTRYYNFSCQPIHDGAGGLLGVLNVGVEVTEQVESRRRIEQLNQGLESRVRERTRQLSEQQRLLSRILGQVPAYIATLGGPEHRFTFFNERYQELSGGRLALGAPVAELLPEAEAQGFVALLDHVYASGEPFAGTDVPVLVAATAAKPARQYYLDFLYQPLTDGQGQAQGILVFAVDVTDRALARQQAEASRQQVQALNEELAAINEELRATNEELHASNARLQRTNNDLDTFVYTASHDLKAPVANLEGLLTALRDYLPPAEQADPLLTRVLGMMDGAVARFLLTINNLTDVARLQSSAQEPTEPVGLPALVEDVRLDLAPLLTRTHGRLEVDVPAGFHVTFAPKNLRSIVFNLLSNGFKYHHPDRPPVVRLRAERRPDGVQLTVQDNGLGLSPAEQGKLFTLFKRLHTHVEGTGVGLYMLRRIIENAEGTITVQSEPGQGTTFTVWLPRA